MNENKRWVRDHLFEILGDLGIDRIFGVPGTNEIPIIDGCSVPGSKVSYVECLHENIAMGAAMGYARVTGKVGVVLVHVTPGIGHLIGNLFNAWRSKIPVVVLCAQQHDQLVTMEPLLASDVASMAEQFTCWSHEIRTWEESAMVLQRAFKVAMSPQGGPTFVAFPWEFMMHEQLPGHQPCKVTRIPGRTSADRSAIAAAAELLSAAKHPMIVVGDEVGRSGAWDEIVRLAQLTGAPVYSETFSSMANFPNDDFHWQGELPGGQGDIQRVFRGPPNDRHDVAFLCGWGLQAQLAVFEQEAGPLIPPYLKTIALHSDAWEIGKNHHADVGVLGDVKTTLAQLNELVAKHPPVHADRHNNKLAAAAQGRTKAWKRCLCEAMDCERVRAIVVADALRKVIDDNRLHKRFMYAHEAVSEPGFQLWMPLGREHAVPTSYYCVGGGSLGWSMPACLGMCAGGPGLGVTPEFMINVVGDGSSLFYPQVWWTATKHRFPILTIIMNNLQYRTLQVGLSQVITAYKDKEGYHWQPQNTDPEYLRIEQPPVNFLELAHSFGVGGERVAKPHDVMAAVERALQIMRDEKRSYVLEICAERYRPGEPGPCEPQTAALLADASVTIEAACLA